MAAALVRLGRPLLGRSIRYHRPRAPFCGIGACTQCLVRVNGAPGVRACRYEPVPGDRISVENAWPSPELDVGGAFDVLFPRGIDTLRGFRRPRPFVPLYQAVVRRLSGVGALPSLAPPAAVPGENVATDVLVIGGGIAGTATAEPLVAAGRDVLVLDRNPRTRAPSGARAYAGFTASFLPPPVAGRERPFELLAVDSGPRAVRISAASVVVATGGYDASLWFPGNDRPGVVTGDGAIALAGPDGASLFRRALLVGGGPQAASLLERFGERVEAVVAPGAIAPAIAELASRLDVPLFPRSMLLAAGGRRRVHRVVLRSRGAGSDVTLRVDAVVLAHRRPPHAQPFFQAGARMEWSPAVGAYYPAMPAPTTTTVPGLYGVGEAAGYVDATSAQASGAAAAAEILGGSVAELPRPIDTAPPSELPGYYRELRPLLAGRGKLVVCACEDILLDEIEESARRGFRGIEVVKRQTGVGTGLCQGRYCLPDALLWLSMLEGRPPNEVGYITQRPPVFPVGLGALASLPEPPASEAPS